MLYKNISIILNNKIIRYIGLSWNKQKTKKKETTFRKKPRNSWARAGHHVQGMSRSLEGSETDVRRGMTRRLNWTKCGHRPRSYDEGEATPLKTRGNKNPLPENDPREPGCHFSNGGGLAAFPEIQSPQRQHIKSTLFTTLWEFPIVVLRVPAGNVFLHIFPKQRMDVSSIPVAISNAVLS